MRFLSSAGLVLLGASLLAAQSGSPVSSQADTSRISDQIKSLQTAVAEQQKQIQMLQSELEQNKKAQVVNAAFNVDVASNTPVVQSDSDKPKESPLSFRIGGAEFTPGGFVDFENVFRSTNSGSAISTSYGTIPFSNSAAGHLTEYRATGQYSRFNMKITDKFKGNDVTGYIEGDFNGNDATNVFQTTNPHTLRLRLYWVDLKRGQWELVGGQSWGLETPNRVGVSPAPADLAITLNEDANIQVGIHHSRAGLFRLAWHPTKEFAWAFEVQNPQQFTNNEVVFPAAFNAGASAVANQFDNGTANIPNLSPDLMTKLAYDTLFGGKKFHIEAGGIFTTAKIANQISPSTAASPFVTHSKIGGGGMAAMNIEPVKNVRFLVNGMYGSGIGRYSIALGPNAVVRPVALTATTFDADISMVHSGSGSGGIEIQATPNTQIAGYYGGAYFQRNAFPDITAAGATKPIIGFGGATSANTNNRAIQEGTVDFIQTWWKNPQYGSLLTILQASYVTRSPWAVLTTGGVLQPKNAHLGMGFVSLRYVLP